MSFPGRQVYLACPSLDRRAHAHVPAGAAGHGGPDAEVVDVLRDHRRPNLGCAEHDQDVRDVVPRFHAAHKTAAPVEEQSAEYVIGMRRRVDTTTSLKRGNERVKRSLLALVTRADVELEHDK